MADFFEASDLVGAAVAMEQRGQAVYKKMALVTKNPEVKRLFETLAVEEHRHEEIFSAMADRLAKAGQPEGSATEEYHEYLGALLDSYELFSREFTESLLEHADNFEKSVRSSIRLERDSILFFQEMLLMVPGFEKPKIWECIEEERRHLRLLAALLPK
jgi:rubrerythrin